MMSEVLVLRPPIANSGSTLESPLRPHSQLQGPPQAPPLEVAEQLQRGTTIDAERDLDSAS
jgi:hypothetical protein